MPAHTGVRLRVRGPSTKNSLNTDISGVISSPPTGIQDRSPTDIVNASRTRGVLEKLSTAKGFCPRCAGRVEQTTTVWDSHDALDGLCTHCDSLHQITCRAVCTNCPYEQGSPLVNHLFEVTDLLAFLTADGINPIRFPPEFVRVLQDAEDGMLSTDPFEARFTFAIDRDTISLTVDDDLEVVDATEDGIGNTEQ